MSASERYQVQIQQKPKPKNRRVVFLMDRMSQDQSQTPPAVRLPSFFPIVRRGNFPSLEYKNGCVFIE